MPTNKPPVTTVADLYNEAVATMENAMAALKRFAEAAEKSGGDLRAPANRSGEVR